MKRVNLVKRIVLIGIGMFMGLSFVNFSFAASRQEMSLKTGEVLEIGDYAVVFLKFPQMRTQMALRYKGEFISTWERFFIRKGAEDLVLKATQKNLRILPLEADKGKALQMEVKEKESGIEFTKTVTLTPEGKVTMEIVYHFNKDFSSTAGTPIAYSFQLFEPVVSGCKFTAQTRLGKTVRGVFPPEGVVEGQQKQIFLVHNMRFIEIDSKIGKIKLEIVSVPEQSQAHFFDNRVGSIWTPPAFDLITVHAHKQKHFPAGHRGSIKWIFHFPPSSE